MAEDCKPDEATIDPDAYRAKCSRRVVATIQFYRSPTFSLRLILSFFAT